MAKAAKAFLTINFILAILGFVATILSAVVIGLNGKLGSVVFPPTWFYPIIVIVGAIFLISLIGIVAIMRKSRYITCLFLFLNIIILIVLIFSMTTLLLYANAQAGELTKAVASLQAELEDFMFKYGLKNPTDWIKTQVAFDCCVSYVFALHLLVHKLSNLHLNFLLVERVLILLMY